MIFLREEKKLKYGKSRTYTIIKCEDCKEVEVEILMSEFKKGKCKGVCRKCSAERSRQANRLQPFETKFKKLVYNAKRRNINCNLSYENYLDFTEIKFCHYCEKKINWDPYYAPDCHFLDRKNNNVGYIVNNCVICCFSCNDLKSNEFTYEEFMLLAPVLKQIRLARELEEKDVD